LGIRVRVQVGLHSIYEVRYFLHKSEQITPKKKCGLFLKYAAQLEVESKAVLILGIP
jgi:hypothetical protein